MSDVESINAAAVLAQEQLDKALAAQRQLDELRKQHAAAVAEAEAKARQAKEEAEAKEAAAREAAAAEAEAERQAKPATIGDVEAVVGRISVLEDACHRHGIK